VPLSRIFDPDSHARFAALSGDLNPIHMDAIVARRTQAGAPVVHGVHTLLWLLECVAGRHPDIPTATNLKARFRKMVYIGDRADTEILQITSSALRARVLVDGMEVISVSLGFDAPQGPVQPPGRVGAASAPPPPSPVDLPFDRIPGLAGRLRFAAGSAELERMFPHAARYLGVRRTAALACSSCLVGMVVPGLHSLYGGLDLSVGDDRGEADELDYAVTAVDQRFRMVRLAIRGGGLVGSLDTICRLPHVAQASIASIAPLVAKDEFRKSNALVVGGSRGLGEVTAKLIAAGGGNVTVTYSSGKTDADAVAREIRIWGGHCETAHYDVRQRAAPQLAALPCIPTHLYYFATPTIFKRRAGIWDPRIFEEFNTFYLDGFADLAEACLRLRPEGVCVFYPSTVYVDSWPAELTEYAMSKAAGEILCAGLQIQLHGLRMIARRLPRLPTDQTNSLVPIDTADPLDVILPIVREMQASNRAS